MTPTFRQRLVDGVPLVGTIVTLPSPEVADVLSRTGLDWLFLDAEHGVLSSLDAQRLIQAMGGRCASIVRVPEASETPIKQMLDIGADGVLVPQVNTAEQARRVVEWCRYPPTGRRGVGLARAHGYGLDFADYVASANDAVSVIVQAEHIDAVDNIEAIVAVEGIDAVLIGPYDLSASLGKTGEVEDPEVVGAIDTVTRACRDAGVALGIFGVNADAVRPYLERNYSLLAVGTDALFLLAGAQAAQDGLR